MNKLFNDSLKLAHKNRAARRTNNKPNFIVEEAAQNLSDRISQEIKRDFLSAFEIQYIKSGLPELTGEKKFDLITSVLTLHWVNELPQYLIRVNNSLEENGLFIANIFGGRTLHELRKSIYDTEISIKGGVSPRISPFIHIKDAGNMLHCTKFQFPVVDSYKITVMYEDIYTLINDIRDMGETNALLHRNKMYAGKMFMSQVNTKYHELYENKYGDIPATFEIITLTGWK